LQSRDNGRAVEPEKCIHLTFLRQRRHECVIRVLILDLSEQLSRRFVVGFTIHRELQIIDQIIVAGIDQGVVRQLLQLSLEGVVQLTRVTTVMAVSGTRIEQCVAAEQSRLIGLR